MKQCPNCRLANPDSAQACDCGFDFALSVHRVATDSKHGGFVLNALSGKLYGISTCKNPFFGAWETAVLERPGFVNWLLGRRRLVWRVILVTYEIIGARIGAELMRKMMKQQPIAWVVVESSPSAADVRVLHLLAKWVVKDHPEDKWKDLFCERIKSDLAHLNPDIVAEAEGRQVWNDGVDTRIENAQEEPVTTAQGIRQEDSVKAPGSVQPTEKAQSEQLSLDNTSLSSETAITEIILKEIRDGEKHEGLIARIEESGDLLLEGQDIGPAVEKFWGDLDYEYWLRVRKEHKDAVLLHLLRDQFDSESAFRAWLEKRRIPCEFHNWV